jgi:hypothetical protein
MEGHLRTCSIDGLNIGNYRFNWKDKLIIFHNKEEPDNNLVNIHLHMPRPFSPIKTVNGEIASDENRDHGEALETIVKFLVCYYLTTDYAMPKILMGSWSVIDLKHFNSIDQVTASGFIHHSRSTISVFSEGSVCDGLKDTIPLFEKVMDITTRNREPLTVAMIFYYNSKHATEIYSTLLGLVTVLETLFTENDGETKYKFSLRTSIFVEDDPEKRLELFEKLKKIYKERSELVHGDDVSLNPTTVYHDYVTFLSPIVFDTLARYIELLSNNLTKKEIIKQIDAIALGSKDYLHFESE